MTDLHRPCPYRSEEPVGEFYCACQGKHGAYVCSHPEIDSLVSLHAIQLRRRVVKMKDGTHEKLKSHKISNCTCCQLRPKL